MCFRSLLVGCAKAGPGRSFGIPWSIWEGGRTGLCADAPTIMDRHGITS